MKKALPRVGVVQATRSVQPPARVVLFPGNAKIEFPIPHTYVIHKASPSKLAAGGWPLRISVVEQGDASTPHILLELDRKPKNDILDLTRDLYGGKPLRGEVTLIDGNDVVGGSARTDAHALAKMLSSASSFTVATTNHTKKTSSPHVAESKAGWGATNPVLGALELVGTTPEERKRRIVFVTLYNTNGLRQSLSWNRRGQLVVRNLHPYDLRRLRCLGNGAVGGILLYLRRHATVEKMFPRGQA
ncbi:Hypothetical protein, putative, partial [Bodo saltans]